MTTTRSVKLLLSAGTALFLVGCAGQYTPMRQLEGNAFTKHLYHGYTALSQSEGAMSDWNDQDYFMAKAERAAGGEAVAATDLADLTFPDDLAIDAMIAQAKLKGLLEGQNAVALHPGPAAKLQVAYDCYLQQLAEGRDQTCKDEFDHQASRLEQLLRPAPVSSTTSASTSTGSVAQSATASATATVTQTQTGTTGTTAKTTTAGVVPGPFNIYFGLDSAEISKSYMKTIKAIADQAQQSNVTKVNIYGHTDRSGDAAYNSRLGLKRAMAVQRALRASGLDQGVRMSVSTKGENDLKVKTADGVKERLNRRVELVLSR